MQIATRGNLKSQEAPMNLNLQDGKRTCSTFFKQGSVEQR